MKKISRCLPMLAAALGVQSAFALGLGELHISSTVGNRLQATVDLYASPTEAASDWHVDVLPDGFAGPEAAPAALLSELRARFVRAPQGRHYIQIESLAPVDYTALAFRLRVSRGTEAMTGRYLVSLAPISQPAPPPRPKPSRPQANVALPPTDVQSSAGPDAYGPVRPGESLWSIARKLGGTRGVNGLMQALFERNPAAFVAGDMNRLKVGAILALPSGTRPATQRQAGSPEVSAAPPLPAAAAPVEVAAGQPPSPVVAEQAAGSAPTTTRSLAQTDPELAARLSALDRKFAEIRAQYGSDAKASATTLAASTVATPIAPAAVAQPGVAEAPRGAKAAATVRLAKAFPASSTPKAVLPPTSDEVLPASQPVLAVEEHFESFGLAPIALFGALAAAGFGVYAGRRYLGARSAPFDARHDPARDATLKAEVARKSENRVRLEKEIKAMVAPRKGPGYRPGTTVQLNAPPPMPRGATVDGGSEIDSSIANGFYTEAEQTLRKLIEKDASNAAAKLRLAEVLYMTEQSEAFATLAQDMMVRHRKAMADDDWQRVIRMGKMIAPDFPLFSGPRQVELRA